MNKINRKFFAFVLSALLSVVCVYALVSYASGGGYVGVPLRWQKYLEISQEELYKNLAHFSIVGANKNILRQHGDKIRQAPEQSS
ncbi:hypothetical protein RsTz2092_02000 [Deferribacterales bacterium RsTz2092]